MTPPAPSRRGVVTGGTAALSTTVAAQALGSGSASATTARANPATTVPTATSPRYTNRPGCGFSRHAFAS